jgi:hypothetical protein
LQTPGVFRNTPGVCNVGGWQDEFFCAFTGAVGVMHDAILIDPAISFLCCGGRYRKQADEREKRAQFHPVSIAI